MFKNTNGKIKKMISSVLALAIIVGSTAFGMNAFADGGTPITKANFSDDIWREIISIYLDENSDGVLSQEEINSITLIDVSGFLDATYGSDSFVEIADLSGIERFTSLKTLRVGGIGLESLDVSALGGLTSLTCQGNYLESLNISSNTALTELNCSGNFIEELNLSNNTGLTKLICQGNYLSEIDVSGLNQLELLNVSQNELTSIDLSHNTQLSTLNCSNNHLRALDLSHNPLLSGIVENAIGKQTIEASANYSQDDGSIYADVTIPNHSRIVSTSLDRVEEVGDSVVYVKGYDGSSFVTYEPEAILGGVDYYYSVGLDEAEDMSVHINVERDFYVVRFYEDEALENKLGEKIVNGGDSVTFETPVAPLCKEFVSWSSDLGCINDDVQIYAIWNDVHSFQVASFENGVVDVNCANGCGESHSYTFAEHINATNGDANYVEGIDINSDGIINAKDYARLLKGQY